MGKFGFTSGKVKLKSISTNKGTAIEFGALATRAGVLAEFPNVGIGSIYVSTTGVVYVKVAAAGAAADWQKVTTTAAD